MRYKGEIRTIWVFGVIAIIVLILSVFGLWDKLGVFIFGARQLPDFNFTNKIPEGSIIGLNLADGSLRYYIGGESWRVIDSSQQSFLVGLYEFAPGPAQEAFKKFYASERRPASFELDASYWRKWTVSNIVDPGLVVIGSREKNGFPWGDDLRALGYINHLNIIDEHSGSINNLIFNLDWAQKKELFTPIIAWRDQILEGNACERFVSFEIIQKVGDVNTPKQTVTHTYTVRKLGNYLFVDLSRPVSAGATQKWDSTDCFNEKIPLYDDYRIDRSSWVNEANLRIDFTYDGSFLFISNKDPAFFLWDPDKKSWFLGNPQADQLKRTDTLSTKAYITTREQATSFTDGLFFFFGDGTGLTGGSNDDDDIKVYVVDGAGKILSGPMEGLPLNRDGELKIGAYRALGQKTTLEIVYDITGFYNEHFKEAVSQDFLNAPPYVFTPAAFSSSGTSILGGSLLQVRTISTNPLHVSTTTVDRIAVYKNSFGEVTLYDTFSLPNRAIGGVGADGVIIINDLDLINVPLLEDIQPAINGINGKKLEDLYYMYSEGINELSIQKAALPSYLQPIQGTL